MADTDETMLCAQCLVDPKDPDNSIEPASTAVAGTLLCLPHAVEAVRLQRSAGI
jgi:hypothetical protein